MQSHGDHEGLVEIGRDIEGVEVSVFLRQKPDKDNYYKISMRSGELVNVADICMLFGGGGHQRAAGANIQGTIEQIKQRLVKEVHNSLEKQNMK